MAPKSVTKTKTTTSKTKKEVPAKKKTASVTKPAAKKAPGAKKASAKAAPKTAKATAPKKAAAKSVAAKKPAVKKVAPKKKADKTPDAMPEQLRNAAMKVLDDRKATDIICVDLHGKSAIADYAIVATGGSARQLAAIAEYLREAFFKIGMKKLRVEGLPQGDWVLIDAGDVLIHLFRAEVREYYQLEEIWSASSPSAQ